MKNLVVHMDAVGNLCRCSGPHREHRYNCHKVTLPHGAWALTKRALREVQTKLRVGPSTTGETEF